MPLHAYRECHIGWPTHLQTRAEALEEAALAKHYWMEKRAWSIIVALASSLEQSAIDPYNPELERSYDAPQKRIS